jgi:CheY-like chemotaxis protein
MDMNDPITRASEGCYIIIVYHYNKPKRIFSLGSHDPKYYDQIITKLKLQTRKQHEHSLLQDQTITARSKKKKKKKRVFLVDDEPDICMVYQMVLEDAGFECISYTDPVKALKDFRIDYYDLIILDIIMPVLNGFELCKKIMELDRTIHVIFITAAKAYYEQFRTQHFPELGKINYIQKPIGNDELVQIVNIIVGDSITMD